MKKIIVILIIFVLMIGAMTAEIVYVNKFYNGLQAELESVAINIEDNKDNLDNAFTVDACESVVKKWEKGKRSLLMLQNHNTIRALDDKMTSMLAVVKSDNYNDAVIFVQSAINFIDDILLDAVPYLSNIL